ncbi:MAG: SCO family protein [Rhodocyclaceae bacterium]|nr:SCO family protein [Rhodocyclaceae bacterium]
MSRAWLVLLNLLLIAAIVGVAFFWQPQFAEPPLPGTHAARQGQDAAAFGPASPPVGGDFTLAGPAGPVSLHDFAGKLVLLQFGYTYCPDICPTSLALLSEALGRLVPVEAARVQALFVSVDPERDDAARLAEYTAFFHPAILGLTGEPQALAEIASRYGAVFSRQANAAGGYTIDHTALTYLIDGQGRLVASLPHATPVERLVAEIRRHLPPSSTKGVQHEP